MSSNRSLTAHLDAAASERFTGSVAVGRSDGVFYFLFGNLVHAIAKGADGIELTGLEAVRELGRRFPRSHSAKLTPAHPVPENPNLAGIPLERVTEAIEAAQAVPAAPPEAPGPTGPPAPPLPPLPLLPAGTKIFEQVPLSSINFDLLLSTLSLGMMTIE